MNDRQKNKRYPGTTKMPAGFAGFDKKFTLRANIAEAAQAFFEDKEFKMLLEDLPDMEFYIKDEDCCFPFFSLLFPEEADVLVLTVTGSLRKKDLKHEIINVFKKALDRLVKMEVLDPENEPIGKF